MGYDKLSYETDKDKVLQGFLDEIKKRDFESRLDREAIELRDAEIKRLKAEVVTQDEDIETYKSEHVRLITLKDTLRAQVEELEAAHPSVVDTAKIIALREESDTLRARVEELTREVDMYNGITLGEVVKERDQLQRINDLVHQQLGLAYTEHAEEMQELRTEVERRGGYMDELAEEVDKLREELRLERADHYSTVKKLGNRAVNAEQVCDQLRILNGQQVFEIEKYASEVLELRDEVIDLRHEREMLREKLAKAEDRIASMDNDLKFYEGSLPKKPTVVKQKVVSKIRIYDTNHTERYLNILEDGTVTVTDYHDWNQTRDLLDEIKRKDDV